MMTTPKQSALDVKLGDNCSAIAFDWARQTFTHRKKGEGKPVMGPDGFFGQLLQFGNEKIAITSDGIGTKIEVAERLQKYDTLGFDLMAMVVDDLICVGAEPTSVSNILDVDYLDDAIVNNLMQGLYHAAKVARVTITGGEIAELGKRIHGYGPKMHFNWGATALGYMPKGRPILDGTALQKGDVVVSLQSSGFRSNGFSLARKILETKFGENWHNKPYDTQTSWGEVLLQPSKIYAPIIGSLWEEGFSPKGIVHVTGGGVAGNLKRLLRVNKLGAVLDHLFKPHDFMFALQALGNISESMAYCLWNMGNGLLLVVQADHASPLVDFLNSRNYPAQIAGIIDDKANIRVHSLGTRPQTLAEGI